LTEIAKREPDPDPPDDPGYQNGLLLASGFRFIGVAIDAISRLFFHMTVKRTPSGVLTFTYGTGSRHAMIGLWIGDELCIKVREHLNTLDVSDVDGSYQEPESQ